jgi:hypothetical protein
MSALTDAGSDSSRLDMTPQELLWMFAKNAKERATSLTSIAARCEEREPRVAREALKLADSERLRCVAFLCAWAACPPLRATSDVAFAPRHGI